MTDPAAAGEPAADAQPAGDAQPAAVPLAEISPDDFFRADIRAGTVVAAGEFPKARKPAYKLVIDFGPLGTRKSSAQITARYTPAELIGQTVIAVVNFPPRQIADFCSEVLVLGVTDGVSGDVVLLRPDTEVKPGTRVT